VVALEIDWLESRHWRRDSVVGCLKNSWRNTAPAATARSTRSPSGGSFAINSDASSGTEDRQQRADGLEHALEEGCRVGRDRTNALRDSVAADSKPSAGFYDFEEFERLLEATKDDVQANLIVLLGGEAGVRCGELMALEWQDVNWHKRQLTVARSEWKGHVTMPKSGRLRYVGLTHRLHMALRAARHLRGPRAVRC
jgi:integrase